jgi:hypothetical protein
MKRHSTSIIRRQQKNGENGRPKPRRRKSSAAKFDRAVNRSPGSYIKLSTTSSLSCLSTCARLKIVAEAGTMSWRN